MDLQIKDRLKIRYEDKQKDRYMIDRQSEDRQSEEERERERERLGAEQKSKKKESEKTKIIYKANFFFSQQAEAINISFYQERKPVVAEEEL